MNRRSLNKHLSFAGNHHLLSERQRLALVRSISPKGSIEERVAKEVHELKDSVVYIDTFNTVILLYTAIPTSMSRRRKME